MRNDQPPRSIKKKRKRREENKKKEKLFGVCSPQWPPGGRRAQGTGFSPAQTTSERPEEEEEEDIQVFIQDWRLQTFGLLETVIF